MQKISIFWFRRDLRLEDNKGLSEALKYGEKIIPIFIFDKNNKLVEFGLLPIQQNQQAQESAQQ